MKFFALFFVFAPSFAFAECNTLTDGEYIYKFDKTFLIDGCTTKLIVGNPDKIEPDVSEINCPNKTINVTYRHGGFLSYDGTSDRFLRKNCK